MKFSEFCSNYFQGLTDVQKSYVWHVDHKISTNPKIKYFGFTNVPRGEGLTTIKCAHAAWLLNENPLSAILLVGQNASLTKQFTINVNSSFGTNTSRLLTTTLAEIQHSPRHIAGIKFNFVFCENCNLPVEVISRIRT